MARLFHSTILSPQRLIPVGIWVIGLGFSWSLPLIDIVDRLSSRDRHDETEFYVPAKPASYYARLIEAENPPSPIQGARTAFVAPKFVAPKGS